MSEPRQYPVRVCPLADSEHRGAKRQYAHVFHRPGGICVARAFHRLPRGRKLAVLLHEAGHLWAGPRGGEDAANRAAKTHTGVTVFYRDAGKHGEELEWIEPKDEGRAARALGVTL